jgi:hypothetical protein
MYRQIDRIKKLSYWKLILPFLIVVLFLGLAASAGADFEKKFQFSTDATIMAQNRYENYGNSSLCSAGSNRSTLLMWNISSLPNYSQITAATIHLQVKYDFEDIFYVYGLRKRWVENEVSWEKSSRSTWWSKSGASGYSDRDVDYAGYLLADDGGKVRITLDSDLVQKWFDYPTLNYGVIIAARPNAKDDLIFYCSETTDADARPKLVVKFERR